MSVVFNDVALRALLVSEQGPVGQHVKAIGERVAAQAQENARIIMHRNPVYAEAVRHDFVEGLGSVVGIVADGNITGYLAWKANEEKDGGQTFRLGWLVTPLADEFP